jgi:hypothetical protein
MVQRKENKVMGHIPDWHVPSMINV